MRPVTVGKRYQVATSPHASSIRAATRPPCASPGPPWWRSSKENVVSYRSEPSASGCGSRNPIGLSPQPKHAGSWCGGILTLLERGLTPFRARRRSVSQGRGQTPSRKRDDLSSWLGPLAHAAALEMGLEEVLRAGRGHRG